MFGGIGNWLKKRVDDVQGAFGVSNQAQTFKTNTQRPQPAQTVSRPQNQVQNGGWNQGSQNQGNQIRQPQMQIEKDVLAQPKFNLNQSLQNNGVVKPQQPEQPKPQQLPQPEQPKPTAALNSHQNWQLDRIKSTTPNAPFRTPQDRQKVMLDKFNAINSPNKSSNNAQTRENFYRQSDNENLDKVIGNKQYGSRDEAIKSYAQGLKNNGMGSQLQQAEKRIADNNQRIADSRRIGADPLAKPTFGSYQSSNDALRAVDPRMFQTLERRLDSNKQTARSGVDQGVNNFLSGATQTFAKFPANSANALYSAVDAVSPEGSRIDKFAEKMRGFSQSKAQNVENAYKRTGVSQQAGDNSFIATPASGVGQIGSAIAGGGTLSALNTGLDTFSSTQRDMNAKGVTDETKQLLTAAPNAVAQGFLEKIGVENLQGKVGEGLVRNLLFKAASEGSQEAAQELTGNIATKSYDKSQNILENVPQAAGWGALLGGGTSLALDSPSLVNKATDLIKNRPQLNQGGYVEVGRTPKTIHPDDQNVMSDFIDTQRGVYKPTPQAQQALELDASRIAERYGLDMPNTTQKLANVFDQRLQQEKFAMPKPSLFEKAKERLTLKDQGGYIQTPGIADPVVNKKTGETLSQAVEKLKNFGWSGKDIQGYKNAVLGKYKPKVSDPNILDSVNPTGGLNVDYDPGSRMKMKLADNITTLDKTMGGNPDDKINVYRGAPATQKSINPGDFITTSKELAASYTGEGNVLEQQVYKSDILDDKNEPLGDEYLYRPQKKSLTERLGLPKLNEGGYVQIPFGRSEVNEGLSKPQIEFINDYAEMLEGMGTGQGVEMVPDAETGYKRISNNVRDAETKGKRMSKYDWFNKAKRDIESGRSMYGASEDYKNLPGVESQAQRSNPDEQFAPDSRMSPEEIASQNASAVRGNFQEQVVEGKPSVKRVSELPKSLDDFDKSIGGTGDIESELENNAVAMQSVGQDAKKLMEAINQDEIITKAAAEAQQSGKEINFYAEKDAGGRSVGIKRFDPRNERIEAGFVTDTNGKILGNHIKVDPTGVQVNVGGELINMGDVLGDVTKWGNDFKASETQERNIFRNAPDKQTAEKLYKFTVANKIQNEANYKTELAKSRNDLRQRTKDTMAAKPGSIKKTEYKAAIFDYIEGNVSQAELMGKYGADTTKAIELYANQTRGLYDSLLDRANTEFEKYGMPPVAARKDYITHINELMGKKSFVGEVAGQLQSSIADEGKQTTRGAVPGSIAGRTETFKPSKQWNKFFQERKGGEFTRDPFKAVDAYLEPTLHNIHMTESGVRARAVESALRTASELKEMDTSKVGNELSESLAKFKAQGGNNELVRGFQEYANAITGKTQAFDRQIIDLGKAPATAVRGWQKLQKIGGQATILGNANSVLMQPLNQVGTLAQVGPKNYLRGIAATISGDKSIEKSPFITARQAKTDSDFKSKGQKILDKGAVPLEIVEMASIKNTWNAMHQQVKSEGIKGQDAIIEADRRTERWAAGRGIADRPEIYRSTIANGVMQYTLEVNAQNKAFWKDLSPKQKATFMVATTGVNSLLGAVTGNTPLPDFLKAIFDSIADFGDDEQEGSALDKVGRTAQRFAGEAASMNPFTSVAANTLLTKGQRQGLFGKDSDLGRYDGTSAPIKVVQNAGSAVQNLAKGEFGKARDSTLRTLPFGNQLRKSLSGVEAINSGDVDTTPWNATRAVLFGANAVKDDSSMGSNKRISDTSTGGGAVNATSTGTRSAPDFSTDDILKGQFSSKDQKAWLKLSDKDKKEAAKTDTEKKAWYDQYQATKRVNKDNPDRPGALSKQSADVLNWHNKRTPEQRKNLAYTQNDYDYKLAQAKYEEDKLNGKISRADDINRQQKLRKEAVGVNFSKDTRDIYNKLSKSEILDLAKNSEDGQDVYDKVKAYGDALVEAGSLKYNKLGGKKKSGKGRKGGKGGKGRGGRKGGKGKAGGAGTYQVAKTTDISKKLQDIANSASAKGKSSVSTPRKHSAKLKKVRSA